MADVYLTQTYVEAHLGKGYTRSALQLDGVEFTTLNESATGLVQAYMRNSGYTPPGSIESDGTGVEEAVKLATLGAFTQLLTSIPEVSIPLPENWDVHPANVAYLGLLNGDMQLAATPSQAGAVGGMVFTSSDPDVDGSLPPRASRSQLEGY